MKTVTLTQSEVKILSELLSLDMDNIGFDDKEQDILYKILTKLG